MYVLGLSFDYHDAAAALVEDGVVVAAAQEERFTRKKNDPSFPANAASFCLERAGIGPEKLERIVFYERPLLKFDRILNSALMNYPKSMRYFATALGAWGYQRKFDVVARIAEHFGVPRGRVGFTRHHDSHAAAAFFCSPFDEAAIVTLDGVGEYETALIAHGRGNSINRIASVSLPGSLGLFYSAFTAFLGFRVNEDEYKVMGMSAYGRPVHYDEFMKWFSLNGDGTFRITEQKHFDFLCPEKLPYTETLVGLLGEPREPESAFRVGPSGDPAVERSARYADIASSAQKCTEEVILNAVSGAMKKTGSKNVCMAGGVALNSLANGRIRKELGCNLYVHPAAGDAGGAVGAALYYTHCEKDAPRRGPLTNPFLGKEYGAEEIEAAIQRSFTKKYRLYEDDAGLVGAVAELLRGGAVVGWFQGRFEWGPRALGARSILANPTIPGMKDIVNNKIKFREPFRPFAPAVLEERAADFFDLVVPGSKADPEYFMLAVCRTRDDKKEVVPAVTHVDGTARVQLVNRDLNPLYYGLIAEFGRLTGVPVVLNTSFNLRGEPIVNTPLNAIRTFEWSDMDYLAMGRYLIEKE